MKGDTVLARAFGSEPLRRVVWELRRDKVMLVHPDYYEAAVEHGDLRPIGFPSEDVFVFDQILYQQLSDAFKRRSWADLEILWTKAKPYAGERVVP